MLVGTTNLNTTLNLTYVLTDVVETLLYDLRSEMGKQGYELRHDAKHNFNTAIAAIRKLKQDVDKTQFSTQENFGNDSDCLLAFIRLLVDRCGDDDKKMFAFYNYINLVFRKDFSAQVLKANMKVVGNCEYGLLLYREKLPKFNNDGRMIFNCFDWVRDNETPKVHPTQKPVPLLRRLIEIFTDKGDVVIDPCAGSGSTLLAAAQLGRRAYGFEIKKDFYSNANKLILSRVQQTLFQ